MKRGTFGNGVSHASSAADAKAVAAWPDGNDGLGGTRTSGSGSGNRRGGRSRPIAWRRMSDSTSARRLPNRT